MYPNDEQTVWLTEKYPCPHCDSSDAVKVSEHTTKDGKVYHDARCFSCQTNMDHPVGFEDTSKRNFFAKTPSVAPVLGLLERHRNTPKKEFSYKRDSWLPPEQDPQDVLSEYNLYPYRELKDRKLTRETCEHYGVRVTLSETTGEPVTHLYPRYKGGKMTGYKQRIIADKNFFSKGDCRNVSLFGSNVVKPNGKTLYITEGELDTLSLYQVLKAFSTIPGWEPSVVSLSNGASSAAKDISIDFDFVNSFDKVVLCFDQDDAGKAATEDACKLLAGKVYIATFAEKDPNAMLVANKAEELKWDVLKHRRQYQPDGIVNYADCWERYKEGRNQTCYAWPAEWKHMNDKTYGIRMGELITITSGSGSGKSQLMRELKYHYHKTTDFMFADIALEEDVGDSMAGLIALRMNQRITLPDVDIDEHLEQEAFKYFFDSRRWTGYDYFGGLDNDNLFSKIRFFAATGHKIIFLDHLSIIVSEFASDGGERERIDTIMTKLAKMVKELSITIFLIVHLVKTKDKPFEEGYVPTLDDLRGSGTLKQLSWMVIAMTRNQQHEDNFCANTSELTVLKCRFTGRTGTADYLHFNDTTGRMVSVPKPDNYRPPTRGHKPNFQPVAF